MEEEHKKEESEKLEDKANEKEKKSLIEKIKSALSPVKKFLLGIGTVLLKLWKPVKIICEWIMYIWKMITNRKCLTFYTFIVQAYFYSAGLLLTTLCFGAESCWHLQRPL